MNLGIILIHGYSGSSDDFQPLTAKLTNTFGEASLKNVILPGHNLKTAPAFDEELFIETIHQAIIAYQKENRKLIIIGHSTGGSLALATLLKYAIKPELLALIAVPHHIDGAYFARWDAHRDGKKNLPLIEVSLMVKFINSLAAQSFANDFPVLLIHGESDPLVLSTASQTWKTQNFPNSARMITITQANHDIFKGPNSHLVIDIIVRTLNELSRETNLIADQAAALIKVEPKLQSFFEANPVYKNSFIASPAAQKILGQSPELTSMAQTEPIIANIEITTYCNLNCKFCARSRLKKANQHMPLNLFENILGLLPSIYKIVLVGLGEPLIHPQIVDFVKYAKSQQKQVGLVTNGMLLKPQLSKELLQAGLDSIAFSIDGADVNLSSLVRQGTNFQQMIHNIKEFITIAKNTGEISTAVFSAVSRDTVLHLNKLIDQVAELGVDVLMLSDINFKANLDHTLWQNQNEALEKTVKQAVAYGFSKNLPILSVHGLEEFGLPTRYLEFLMIPPAQLYQRSTSRTWCLSPWQTIPIDVNGNITFCDCQPEAIMGNLFETPFSDLWNGAAFQNKRAAMLCSDPPTACKICPRF